jgi:two-component system, NtrC family, sensor histidine kinase PilS
VEKIEDHVFSPKTLSLQLGSLNLWVVEAIRIGFYFFAVATSVITQILNPYFINFNIWLPVYLIVIAGLCLHFVVIFSYSKFKNKRNIELTIFVLDIFFISAISYFTYLSYPIFIVLYIVNVVLCSFVIGSSASFLIAGISTLSYTLIFLFRIYELSGDQLTYILNIMIFYFSALLSGYLRDLLISRGKLLAETQSDYMDLQSLSQIIIKNIGIGLVSYEGSKNITFFNEAAKLILGSNLDTDQDFIKNKVLFEDGLLKSSLTAKSDFSAQKNNQLAQQHTHRQELELDFQGIKKNLEFITTYIPDADFKTRWILLVQDLTEIKNLQKELVLKDKLAAIGQLAGGIAHEIRNPLASISGSVEMLKESTSDLNPENAKLFSIIIKEIDRLNLLITDFLSFVRPEVKRTDEVSVKSLIEDIITLIKFDKKLSENVDFEMNLVDVKIKCDKSKLTQSFINIITNALQALKGRENPKFICNISSEGYFVSIEFTDNGLGMSESTVQRIFEPFYTTKDKGTGLGLAITHRIIEGHGGVIKVISKEKKGTTFFIRLPIK